MGGLKPMLLNSGVRLFLENIYNEILFTPAGVNRAQRGHSLFLPAKPKHPRCK